MAIAVPDIGPRHVLIGDPTTALGADMLAVGLSRRVSIQEQPRVKTGTTVTGNENHESKFYQGTNLTITIEVPRAVATGIRTFLETINSSDEYLALGSSMSKETLVLIHPDDAASTTAGASNKTIWVPSIRLANAGNQAFNADGDGLDDTNFVELTFEAGYVATDQDGTAVPEAALPQFRGDQLSTHGMTWVLPDPYGPAS